MRKYTFLFLVIALCANALYWGIQAVNSAEADDLAMLSEPPEGFTPARIIDIGRSTYDDDEDLNYIDLPQTPQERDIEIQIDRILNPYPAKVVYLDHPRHYLVIEISGWLTTGTDISCERAADLFHQLTGLGLTLEVRGQFVPSAVNPMDHAWTSRLIETGGIDPEVADMIVERVWT